MKRLFATILALATLALGASAQNVVTDFTATLKGRCAAFSYNYSLSGKYPVSGSGTVTLQGDSFTMKGDGLEVYCNGRDRWTVDTESEECYIESVKDGEMDVEANPALLVGAVDKAFKLKKTASSTFTSQKVTEAVLVPASDLGNITEASLFITAAQKPVGAVIHLSDGTLITITIKDFTLSPERDASAFSLDTKKLDKHYVITDLR